MPTKAVNSYEIARLAGVSRSTVSRVINHAGHVKEETRDHVLRIIQEYSYSPDYSAQRLAGMRSNNIGLFFAAKSTDIEMNEEDVLINLMMQRIVEIASAQDFFVLTRIIHDISQEDQQLKIREMFTQRRIDGGVFIGFPNHYALIEELISLGHVLGILDQHIPGRNEPNRIIVNFDDNTMGKAVTYLVNRGHRSFLTVLGDPRRYNGVQKQSSFEEAMLHMGLAVRQEWLLHGGFDRSQAKMEMKRYLRQAERRHTGKRESVLSGGALNDSGTQPVLDEPTAILCCNDEMAYGVMDALAEHGLCIPRDFSLVSVDDAYMSRFTSPPLTTYRVEFGEILQKLTDNVIAYIRKPFRDHRVFVFPSEMVERGSCVNGPFMQGQDDGQPGFQS